MSSDAEEKAYELNYRATSSTILSMQGKTLDIKQPLIASFGKPTGGWGVRLRVKGQHFYLGAETSKDAYFKVKDTLNNKLGLTISDDDIWLNMNIQWYQRLQPKYYLVRLADLLRLADPVGMKEQTHNPRVRNYTPSDWGRFAWDFMGIYLSQDDYYWDEYFATLERVQKMLNKDNNPSIGCNECYIEFTKELESVRNTPMHDVNKAREWLVNFHNKVNKRIGKPMFPYELAAKRYFWK